MARIQNPLKNDTISHPGLLLEKWHEEWEEGGPKEFVRTRLSGVTKAAGDEGWLQAALARRRLALASDEVWLRTTTGPMSLHLAASGSFENAGICLHPLYGFAYMPGTGIKGMARAYAITVEKASPEDLCAVFGPEITGGDSAECGGVVFYEAWPTKWPKLEVDIVNNHHRDYYEGTGNAPPEDWEQPNPVNFLTLKRGAEFEFAVAPRRKGAEDAARLVGLAKGWVDGALQWLGAGAKTNAGYGRFATATPLPENSGREVFECTLRLVSPAFLAGAMQEREDCTLRAATLRGVLRWWWRTLHAGYLTVADLRQLEGRLWGTTKAGACISVSIEEDGGAETSGMDARDVCSQYGLERPKMPKNTQGVVYISYGMQAQGEKSARNYAHPGACWKLAIHARPENRRGEVTLSASAVLEQALASLWCVCNLGGVGSKSRRGFGSLEIDSEDGRLPGDVSKALEMAAGIRPAGSKQGLKEPSGCSISHLVGGGPLEVRLPGQEPWYALDQLGFSYQAFAASMRHQRSKAALGLPRKVDDSRGNEYIPHPHPSKRRERASFTRHASPLHFHVLRREGAYWVRATAFVDPCLPNSAESRRILEECLQKVSTELEQRLRTPAPAPKARSRPAGPAAKKVEEARALSPGMVVRGKLVERNKKGTWFAAEESTGEKGPIQNTREMTGDFQSGDVIDMKVKIWKPPSGSAFEWLKGKGGIGIA